MSRHAGDWSSRGTFLFVFRPFLAWVSEAVTSKMRKPCAADGLQPEQRFFVVAKSGCRSPPVADCPQVKPPLVVVYVRSDYEPQLIWTADERVMPIDG